MFCFRCGLAPEASSDFCPACGAPLSFVRRPSPQGSFGDLEGRGVWRYSPFLPEVPPVSLGEGGTPLLPSTRLGADLGVQLLFKLEHLNPTGSFKDRGAAVMVAVLGERGARKLGDDSSGNAGAALSAYAARAGIPAVVFVPASASGPKLRQIEALGAEVVRVPGPRPAATAALEQACAADPELTYASHNASPYFLAGLRTLAYEIVEDLNLHPPDHVVVPIGGGGLYLGLFYGFSDLRELRWLERVPKIHGVQAEACAPIARAYEAQEAEPVAVELGDTVAEGARIPNPVRGAEVLWALEACRGQAVAVTEEEILHAQGILARREGIYVEPTSALALAGLFRLVKAGAIRNGETVVIPLTGSGLKAPGHEDRDRLRHPR